MLLRLKPGADFAPSDVPSAGTGALIVVRVLINGIPVGGMSYAIDPHLKAPPDAGKAPQGLRRRSASVAGLPVPARRRGEVGPCEARHAGHRVQRRLRLSG